MQIDYQHFFRQLLRALLFHLVIVDISRVIRFSNERARELFEMRHTKQRVSGWSNCIGWNKGSHLLS